MTDIAYDPTIEPDHEPTPPLSGLGDDELLALHRLNGLSSLTEATDEDLQIGHAVEKRLREARFMRDATPRPPPKPQPQENVPAEFLRRMQFEREGVSETEKRARANQYAREARSQPRNKVQWMRAQRLGEPNILDSAVREVRKGVHGVELLGGLALNPAIARVQQGVEDEQIAGSETAPWTAVAGGMEALGEGIDAVESAVAGVVGEPAAEALVGTAGLAIPIKAKPIAKAIGRPLERAIVRHAPAGVAERLVRTPALRELPAPTLPPGTQRLPMFTDAAPTPSRALPLLQGAADPASPRAVAPNAPSSGGPAGALEATADFLGADQVPAQTLARIQKAGFPSAEAAARALLEDDPGIMHLRPADLDAVAGVAERMGPAVPTAGTGASPAGVTFMRPDVRLESLAKQGFESVDDALATLRANPADPRLQRVARPVMRQLEAIEKGERSAPYLQSVIEAVDGPPPRKATLEDYGLSELDLQRVGLDLGLDDVPPRPPRGPGGGGPSGIPQPDPSPGGPPPRRPLAGPAKSAAAGAFDVTKKLAEFVGDGTARATEYIARRWGPAGEQLRALVVDSTADHRMASGRIQLPVQRALERVPFFHRKEVSQRLRAMVEGKQAPRSAAEADLVREVRRAFEQVADYANEAGVRIKDSAFRDEVLRKSRKGQKLTLKEESVVADWEMRYGEDVVQTLLGKKKELTGLRRQKGGLDPAGREAAKQLADEIAEVRAGMGSRPVPTGWDEFFPRRLSRAVMDKIRSGDESTMRKFAELNDLELPDAKRELLEWRDSQVSSMHAATERPRRFKVPEEWLDTDGLRAATTYIDRGLANASEQRWFKYRDPDTGLGLKGQGRLGDALERIRKEYGQGDAARASTIVERIFRRHAEDSSTTARAWGKIQSGMGIATAGRYLAGSLTLPLQQMTQFRSLATLVGSRRALAATLRVIRKRGALREEAIKSGALRPGEFLQNFGFDDTPSGAMLRTGRRALDAAMAPTQFMDELWRTVADDATPGFAEDLGARLRAGGPKAEAAKRNLRNLDMSADDVAEIASGTIGERTLNKLRQGVTRMSQIEGAPADLPQWMMSPHMAWARQLKTFTMGEMRFFMNFAVKELSGGNAMPMARYIGWTGAIGGALNYLYDQMFGDDKSVTLEDVKRKPELLISRFIDDMQAAAFGGLLGTVALEAAEMVGKPNPRAYAIENLAQPPAVSLATDAASTAMEFATGDTPKGELALKSARDATPFGRHVTKIVANNSLETLRKRLQQFTKKGPAGIRVPRKGQESVVRKLRERIRELQD